VAAMLVAATVSAKGHDAKDANNALTGEGIQYTFAQAQSGQPGAATSESTEGQENMAAVAEALANPLSALWMLNMQNDLAFWDGDIADDTKVQNTFVFQPVISLGLTKQWRVILRPVIPVLSFDTVRGFDVIEIESENRALPFILRPDFDRTTGLGDIVLWTALSNKFKPPNVFGFGPTIMLPTATSKRLGTEKYSAGPMALAAHVGEKWIFGIVAQHWWSFAGANDRDDVNLTDVQYILRYRLTPTTNIGAGPSIRYNWNARRSGDKLTFPVGLGADTVIKIGPLPVKIGIEGHYFVESPDTFGPEWQVRFVFTPVIPAPKWAKKPLFGR